MAGVPDLFIPAWRVWIEMKREKGGSVSTDQKDWLAYLTECGYRCFVARGAEDAKRQIIEIEVDILPALKGGASRAFR